MRGEPPNLATALFTKPSTHDAARPHSAAPSDVVRRYAKAPGHHLAFVAARSGLFEVERPSDSQAALSTLAVKGAYSRRHGKADHRGERPATHWRMGRERFREPDQPAAGVSRVPDAGSGRESHR